MRRGLLFSGLIAGILLVGLPPALAQEEKDPSELARESIELMMRSLNLLIERIPQYEMPVINEDGDIIIRRKRSGEEPSEEEPEDKEPGEPELEKTKT